MVFRNVLVLLAIVGAAGCSFFETPCGRVADSICTIPGETSSCDFLRGVKSENKLAQDTCEKLGDAANAYAHDPGSTYQKLRWASASVALHAVGLVGDQVAQSPKDKLGDAAGTAGDAAKEAGDALSDLAKNAGNVVRDTAKELKDATK